MDLLDSNSVHLPNSVARHCIPVLGVSGPTHGFELAVQNEQPGLTWGMLRDIVAEKNVK